MRKIYKYLSIIAISFVLLITEVSAAGYSVNVTSTSVTIGNSVTLTIKGADVAGKFNISSSNNSVISLSSSSVWIDNNSQSVTLSTKNTGSATITIVPTDVTSYSGDTITGNKTITITVNKKQTSTNNYKPSAPKSTNSYLSSLTIDGYELDNEFDKETLEHSVTVKEGTEKIKINAQLADSSADITGIGEVSVTEGLNTFEIIVTAENGSKRTYTLKVTVKEFEPIIAKINNEEFTVVRKRANLPEISEYFEEKEITIGEDIVEGYYNEKLKYEIVGIKNKKGNIIYSIYKDGKYTKYNEQVFNGKVLQIIDKEVTGGYKKTNFSHNDTDITGYQEVKLDIIKNTYALDNNDITGNKFYLFYAINIETGKEELYQYDAEEQTIQRYNTLVLDMYKEQSNKYYLYLLCSILTLGITIIIFSAITISNNKKRKKLKKKLKFTIQEQEDSSIKMKETPTKKKSNAKGKKQIEEDLDLD